MRKTEHLVPFNPVTANRRTNARIDAVANARTLEHATVGRDGLNFVDAGRARFYGGGGADIFDDGSLLAYYASGSPAVWFGPIRQEGISAMHGLLIQADGGGDIDGGFDVLRAAVDSASGRGAFLTGTTVHPLISFGAVADQVILISPETTTDPVNVNIGTDGHVRLVTSVAASKLDIADVTDLTPAVRSLRARSWIDLGARERGEPDRRVVGLVREEVAEAAAQHPALEPLLLPGNGLGYDRLAVLHQPVLVDHDDRIAALEARATAAEARADALEATMAALAARLDALTTPPPTEAS